MKRCKDCGKEVSNTARRCPACGSYIWSEGRIGCAMIALILFALFMFSIIGATK